MRTSPPSKKICKINALPKTHVLLPAHHESILVFTLRRHGRSYYLNFSKKPAAESPLFSLSKTQGQCHGLVTTADPGSWNGCNHSMGSRCSVILHTRGVTFRGLSDAKKNTRAGFSPEKLDFRTSENHLQIFIENRTPFTCR